MMYRRFLVFCSKILIKALRLLGKNGSALPGLILERLDPKFLQKVLRPVEKNIIIITGTNGKTTTTKMLVTALRATGDSVVTNGTGSNMTRGLISSLVEDMTYLGGLKKTDWFVFEMDEAYTPIFTTNISPKVLVGLNVLRDQLDRYGEVNTTARMIGAAAQESDKFIYSHIDPLLDQIAMDLGKDTESISFGVADGLRERVSNEQSMYGEKTSVGRGKADVILSMVEDGEDASSQHITINHAKDTYDIKVPLKGFHNAMNAAAAVATLLEIDSLNDSSIAAIEGMPVPFGRGEELHIKGKDIIVSLVKNPSGFINNLKTYVLDQKLDAIIFVVNDRIADGRDVSWLWDVDFKRYIKKDTPKLYTSGIRCNDMSLRLKQDGLASVVLGDPAAAIKKVLLSNEHQNILIIPTYTALFEVRQAISKYGKVPKIW